MQQVEGCSSEGDCDACWSKAQGLSWLTCRSRVFLTDLSLQRGPTGKLLLISDAPWLLTNS